MNRPAPLRTHLFVNTLAILLLGMGLAALLAWRAVEGLYIDTQRENLLAQASLIAAALQGQPLSDLPAVPYSQTTNAAPGIHTRLLGENGAVLVSLPLIEGDAAVPAPLAENQPLITPAELLQRPEIEQALQGQPASAIRRVASAGNRRVLYAAAPVFGADGSVTSLVYLAMPLPAAGLPGTLLLQLAVAALVAVLLALAAGMLLARRIVALVQVIAQAAAAVSAGDLNQRVPVENAIGELNGLGQAFNHMTLSLRQSDQAKTAFVADVAHELRTPLTVIKGTIETLEDGALDDIAGRGPLLSSMARETERLIRLVNDLLVLTRADAGKLNMHFQPLRLDELAHARCTQLAALAASHQVQLAVVATDPAAPPCARGDPDRVAQVLDNLLDNAIRYSPPGSTVTVTLDQHDDECHCAVHDCGPGIPQNTCHLSSNASTGRQLRTASPAALVGLTIARALVLAQGGQTAESAPAGNHPEFFLASQRR
jgi:signal transduction histidine kinase